MPAPRLLDNVDATAEEYWYAATEDATAAREIAPRTEHSLEVVPVSSPHTSEDVSSAGF